MKLHEFISWLITSFLFIVGAKAALSQTNFWERTNGPYGGNVYSLAINSKGHIFAGTPDAGVFRSPDNGDNWTPINVGQGNSRITALLINTNGHLFAGTADSGIFRSMDDGETWMPINNGLANHHVNALAINTSGHIFAGAHNGIFRSIDNGATWVPTNMGINHLQILVLAINANGHIFAGTSNGAGIFRSTDNGDHWTAINMGLNFPTPIHYVSSLAINENGHIFAGIIWPEHAAIGGGVFRSMDNGDQWVPANEGLTSLDVSSLAINSRGHIFAGLIGATYGASGGGVFRSIDNGDHWTPINDGLTNTVVYALAINSHDYIFAGTFGGGVFRSIESTTKVQEISAEIPTSFSLEQNYPNPFNPSTTIKFALPRPIYVTLKVYNTLGKEIATIVAENLSTGKQQVVWEAKGMASGIYFYRLQAADFVQTRKLVLVR